MPFNHREICYRSEVIHDHRHPFWEEATIGLEELCNCDIQWPLKITVWDWEKRGRHRVIGSFGTSVAKIMANIAIRGNADRQNSFLIFRDKGSKDGRDLRGRGRLVVLMAKISE